MMDNGRPYWVDEQVVALPGGGQVWRISNGHSFGYAFSALPFSQALPDALVAGETGAYSYNDFGPDHTHPWSEPANRGRMAQTNSFSASFDFKSETDGPQPGLMIEVDASAKQSSTRYAGTRIEDNGTGLDFNTDGGYAAFGLSYNQWHHVKMEIEFVDGLNPDGTGNDIVTITVDGGAPLVTTSWEDYYSVYEPTRYPHAVDCLMFRTPSGSDKPTLLGHGLLIDNVCLPSPVSPFADFNIQEAKIDWKKKPDDDKIMVKGSFVLPPSSAINPGESIKVVIGKFSQTIVMEEKDKGKKWEYKRAKGETGIKDMKIEFKKNEITFEMHVDKEELAAMTNWDNPVLISLQIGDDVGSGLFQFTEKKDKWEYHK